MSHHQRPTKLPPFKNDVRETLKDRLNELANKDFNHILSVSSPTNQSTLLSITLPNSLSPSASGSNLDFNGTSSSLPSLSDSLSYGKSSNSKNKNLLSASNSIYESEYDKMIMELVAGKKKKVKAASNKKTTKPVPNVTAKKITSTNVRSL